MYQTRRSPDLLRKIRRITKTPQDHNGSTVKIPRNCCGNTAEILGKSYMLSLPKNWVDGCVCAETHHEMYLISFERFL